MSKKRINGRANKQTNKKKIVQAQWGLGEVITDIILFLLMCAEVQSGKPKLSQSSKSASAAM